MGQKVTFTGRKGKQVTFNAEWETDKYEEKELSRDITLKMQDLQIRSQKIDMNLLERLIIYLVTYSLEHSLGAILVFLPGLAEINTMQDRLEAQSSGSLGLPCLILPLYSDLPQLEQLKGGS